MHLHQLHVFYHVAKHRSFSRAAEALCLTQPSVSAQVKILEEAYKTKLFQRFGKRTIELTDAGRILYEYVEKGFRLIEEGESSVENHRRVRAGHLRISAIPTLTAYYLPSIIRRFRAACPNIEIHLMGDFQENVIGNIVSFHADLGFIGRRIAHEQLVVQQLWEEELIVILSPSHPLAGSVCVPLDRLENQPFILCEKGSGTREVIDDLIRSRRLSIRTVMEIGDNEALKKSVAAGLGVSIISAAVALADVREGRLAMLRLSDEPLCRTFYAIHHREKHMTGAIRHFLRVVAESSAREADGGT